MSPRRFTMSIGGAAPMDVDVGELVAASSPRRRRAAASPPPASPSPSPKPAPKPALPPAAAAASGAWRQQPPRAGKKLQNPYAVLDAESDGEEEEYAPPPSSPSSSSDSALRPVSKKQAAKGQAAKEQAAKKRATKKRAASGGAKPKKTAGSKPRAKKGDALRKSAAEAAADAAADAAAPHLSDAEKAAAKTARSKAAAKLRELSESGVPHVKPLAPNKPGVFGVPKAPFFSDERGEAAHTLPSVATDAMGAVRDGWPADRRRDDKQLTSAQRDEDRRGESMPTWCSRSEQDAGPPPKPPQQNQKPWRECLDLPEQDRPTGKQKRAVVLRVRFVDQTADAAGVVGAAEPAAGNKTRRDVRRAFDSHGEAQRLVWNEYVKFINSVDTEAERNSLAKGNAYSIVNKALLVQKPEPFSCKAEPDSDEYKKKKKLYDDKAAAAQAVRDKYLGGQSLLDVHPSLRDVHSSVLTAALRDVGKAYDSNLAKQKAQRERGERVVPFTLSLKRPPESETPSGLTPAPRLSAAAP